MPTNRTIPRVCRTCGQPFLAALGEVNRGQGFYCGRPCSYVGQRRTTAERFWEKVQKSESCWLWTAARTRAGYGKMGVYDGLVNRTVETHRVSWEIHHGAIPDGLWVLHNCPDGDNPLCVRPDHLWLGTHTDNMRDMLAKGRAGVWTHPERLPHGDAHWTRAGVVLLPRGDAHRNTKITDVQVVDVRTRYAAGGVTQKYLADEFKVSKSLIQAIVQRKARRHIS